MAFLAEALPQAQGLPKAERLNLAAAVVAFWEEAGLFVYWHFEGETFLTFRHLTFQEYGAARVLADLWEGGKEARKRAWAFLKPRLHHPAWRETLLLLGTELTDATDLVRRVRSAHSPYEWELLRDHALAAAMVGEGAQVEERETRRLVRALRRPLARWRRVAFWVSYTSSLIALMLWGLIWPWHHWPWWGATGSNLLWLLLWWLWLVMPRFHAWYDLLWRRLALPCSAWRMQAVEALPPLHSAAIPALSQAIRDKNWRVRVAAAKALGRIDNAQAVPDLRQALRDEDVDVRVAAAEALGRIGNAQAIPALIHALKDEDVDVRAAAAEALGRIDNAQAVPDLRQALRDEHSWVRRAAAEALGRLGDAQTVPDLRQALGDEDENVRAAAAEALVKIGAPAISALTQALGDESLLAREAATKALGRIGDAKAVPDLRQALRDERPWVRRAAAEALEKLAEGIRDPFRARQVARALWWRLTDLHEDVCNAAYTALQAVAARWAELAVNALPRLDPLQPWPRPWWRRAFWALLAAGAFLLSFTLTALMELLASGVPDSPQAWRAMLFKALLFGVLAGLTTSLGAVGKWLWGRVQAKTS